MNPLTTPEGPDSPTISLLRIHVAGCTLIEEHQGPCCTCHEVRTYRGAPERLRGQCRPGCASLKPKPGESWCSAGMHEPFCAGCSCRCHTGLEP